MECHLSIDGDTPINTGGTTQTFNNLTAGSYTIEVVDANGCSVTPAGTYTYTWSDAGTGATHLMLMVVQEQQQ